VAGKYEKFTTMIKTNKIIKKIKSFTYIFTKSITSTHYYRDLLNTDLRFSLKYYFTLTIVLSLIASLGITLQTKTEFQESANMLLEEMVSIYPEDLTISVEKGTVSINRPQPYFIKAPQTTQTTTNPIENLIVFDTEGTIGDLETYNTLILINKTNILLKDQDTIQVFSLNNIQEGKFDKAKLLKDIEMIQPIIKLAPLLIFILLFGIFSFYFIFIKSILIFVLSILLMTIGKTRGLALELGKYYQMGMHIVTLSLILEVQIALLGTEIPIPLWTLLINLLIGTIVIFDISSDANKNLTTDKNTTENSTTPKD
jgi:hypothetical protein